MENSKALYVYGVVSSGEEIPVAGIDPKASVRLFPYQEIVALVSEVDLGEFGEVALAQNLKNLGWVKEKVLAHEKVLEKVMDSQTVVPMKFGAIFTSSANLEKALADSYETFKALLEKLEGHLECSVKIYGNSEALKATVEKTNPRVQAVSKEIAQESAGVAYLLKKKFDTALSEEVDVEKGKRFREIYCRLSRHAADAKLGSLSPRELTGKEKPMIFHSIFLVARDKFARLAGEVVKLTMEMSNLEWEFQQAGPFPPYNFSEISPVEKVHQ